MAKVYARLEMEPNSPETCAFAHIAGIKACSLVRTLHLGRAFALALNFSAKPAGYPPITRIETVDISKGGDLAAWSVRFSLVWDIC